jgi:hypothetical protein
VGGSGDNDEGTLKREGDDDDKEGTTKERGNVDVDVIYNLYQILINTFLTFRTC